MWTNTCCSHPEHTPDEIITEEDWIGPRRAAVRRTNFELNIDLNVHELFCGARILYKAVADQTFGEYELDYIIFAKLLVPDFKPNPDEVKNHEFVGRKELDDFL